MAEAKRYFTNDSRERMLARVYSSAFSHAFLLPNALDLTAVKFRSVSKRKYHPPFALYTTKHG